MADSASANQNEWAVNHNNRMVYSILAPESVL